MPIGLLGFMVLAYGCLRSTPNVVVSFALDSSGIVHVDGRDVVVRNFQFYVHDVELRDSSGQWRPFVLNAATQQSPRVALVELGKTPALAQIRGRAEQGDGPYSAIRFSLGVPFDLNHANPLSAAAPLDRSELFWSWQLGYKFLRVDLADGEREWSFHLGSTGCVSASSVRPPSAPCAEPNRVRVALEGFDPTTTAIHVPLQELVSVMREANHESCTGAYASTPACAAPYMRTGLDPATGACAGDPCDAQRLFVAASGDQS